MLGESCETRQDLAVAEAQQSILKGVLHGRGEFKQADEVGDAGPVLPRARGDLLLRQVEFSAEPFKGAGLFHWVEVLALEVLDDRDLHRLLVRNLPNHSGHGSLPRPARGKPPPLSCYKLIPAIRPRPQNHGLNYAGSPDGFREFIQRLFFDFATGL